MLVSDRWVNPILTTYKYPFHSKTSSFHGIYVYNSYSCDLVSNFPICDEFINHFPISQRDFIEL